MKERRRDVEGKIFSHENGLGTVTRGMIEDRAREIAVIDGRSRPNKEDRILARQELLRMRGVREEVDEIDEEYETLDPSETPPSHGRHAPSYEPDDEEQVQFELVEQGVEEADHEHMLEGHYSNAEKEEEEVGEKPGKKPEEASGGAKTDREMKQKDDQAS